MSAPRLASIVVPVYNSTVLAELAARIDAVFAGLAGTDYELIFVDDASPDPRVWPTLQTLTRRFPRVRALQLTRNFGQQPATLCGLAEARGEVVLTLDDDLQHAPEDVPKFLALAEWDVVIGQLDRRRHPLGRRLASRAKGFFDHLVLGKPKGIQMSAFRMLSRTVVDGVLSIRTPHPFLPALIFHVSKNVTGVPVSHAPRREGRSGYTLLKLAHVFSNLLINNSSLVLRVVGNLGILFAGISFLMAGFVIYRKLAHGVSVRGWTSLLATQLLIGGLLLFSVGVVGEYLVRIIESSESKPTYFVRRRAGGGEDAAGDRA
ncbi:MAG TPA: glycosyltransferase family 2 protein [Thermoanaerobaculia bacterium]|nr:glycosyltransferase family 2 protein [Thermoanaerobaculia bacterium]